MGIKIGNNNIGDVYVGSDKIGQIFVGSNLVYTAQAPIPAQDFILNVQRCTMNTYVSSSTTYNNDSYIALDIGVGSGGATVTYDGNTLNLTSSQVVRFGKYQGVDDGTATSGQLTISGNYTAVLTVNAKTDKSSYSYVNCITGVVQWFGGQITSIANMFRGQKVLTGSITVPEHITSMGDNCFRNTGISSITALGATTIGIGAFADCNSLHNCTFNSNGISSIGNEAFAGCSYITALTLQKNVVIGYNAFGSSANYITNVAYVQSVTYLGTKDDWITIPHYTTSTTQSYTSPFGRLGSIGKLYINNTRVTFFTIPNGVTKINDGTFAGMSGVSVTMANSVVELGNGAFGYSSINVNTILNSNITTIGAYCFYGNTSTTITLPDVSGSIVIGQSAFASCSSATTVNLLYSDITKLTLGSSAFTSGNANVQYRFADTQANVEAWGKFTTTNFTNTTYYPIS